ncbi:Uncharacterised protein [Vibrio cholerae]|nr:Uncharacterised protein [Vibrio cholerae]
MVSAPFSLRSSNLSVASANELKISFMSRK